MAALRRSVFWVERTIGERTATLLGEAVAALVFLDEAVGEQPLDRLMQTVAERTTEVRSRQPDRLRKVSQAAIRSVPDRTQQGPIERELVYHGIRDGTRAR